MRKRTVVENTCESTAKKLHTVPISPTADVKGGMILTDTSGKKWRLGKAVGTGGFGEIFLASDSITHDVKTDAQYVAKVEQHISGPLFVEIHCYLRIARLQMINKWKAATGIKHLGIPHHIAFGSHVISGTKYRFLIIPRFESDIEKIFESKGHKFNVKTVLTICIQIIDVLQYIHSRGYLHLDIKASNIGFNLSKKTQFVPATPVSSRSVIRYSGCMPVRTCKARRLNIQRVLRPNVNLRTFYFKQDIQSLEKPTQFNENSDRVYLLDYGLACKYLGTDGIHREFSKDERRAHAGTLLFCSRDAHLGAQSRRSDLECLGYNLIYWLTSNLPWSENTDNPDVIYRKKRKCIENLNEFLNFSFNFDAPNFVYEYFEYILSLEFAEEPDYDRCKKIFRKALQEYGYKDDMRLDFDNLHGWNCKQRKCKQGFENFRLQSAIQKFKRTPLNSNLPIRPILRKEIINDKLKQRLNWSRILLDPEDILKKASKERKLTDEGNNTLSNIVDLDINKLNPNSTMLQIFDKCLKRYYSTGHVSPNSRSDCATEAIDGYTPAMMDVHNRRLEREELQELNMAMDYKSSNSKSRTKSSKTITKKQKVIRGRVSKSRVSTHRQSKKALGIRRIYSLRG